MRIGVLFGGRSDEARISRRTGRAVIKALRSLRRDVVPIEVTKNLPIDLKKKKIQFCFIALHGKFGEDGTVQGLCEMMGLPYSGSGVLASAISMNKAFTKQMLLGRGIRTAPYQAVDHPKDPIRISVPFVVKPMDGGSAIGITIIHNKSQAESAVRLALRHSSSALIEKFIDGREVTAPVLGKQVLPLVEIVPKRSFYDYKAKYVKGLSDHILPARVSKRAESEIKKTALKVHQILGCRAFSRSDFIVDRNGKPWFLEINSVPGMTETSLFPESARAAGLKFPQMIQEIIRLSK